MALQQLQKLLRPTTASLLPTGRAKFFNVNKAHRVAPPVERSVYFYVNRENGARTPNSLTFANTEAWMKADGLFPYGFKLHHYAIESPAFRQDPREVSNVVMGVDGRMIAGLVRMPKVVHVGFLASSDSISYIGQIADKQAEMGMISPITLYVSSETLNTGYMFSNGVLSAISDMGEASKIWGERKFTFIFESVTRSPVGMRM